MPTKLKIFYGWQSDTPGKLNHYFIEDSFELDHDTKGVSGGPPIAEMIYRKIDESSLFIADVTTVGEYLRAADNKTRKARNANAIAD